MPIRMRVLAAVLAASAVVACKKKEAPQPIVETPAAPAVPATLSVTDVQIGSAIGADMKVTAPKTTFGVKDTIHPAVLTDGAPPSATITAVWTYTRGGKTVTVDSTAKTIAPTGPATTEFHVSKPGGWPAGTYHVAIWADGQSAGTRDFDVK